MALWSCFRSVVAVVLLFLVNGLLQGTAADTGLAPTPCAGLTDTVGLQTALDSAKQGDIIQVCSDILVKSTIQIAVPVTLRGPSASGPTNFFGSFAASDSSSPLFTIAAGVGPVTFQDFQMQNMGPGSSYHGGAVVIGPGAVVTFIRVVFRNSIAENGAAVFSDGNATFTGCAFVNNTAYGSGGAIYASTDAFAVTIVSSTFLSLTAGQAGGAVFFNGSDGSLGVSNSTFVSSAANGAGGALWVGPLAQALITDNAFLNGSSGAGGGALYIEGDALLASNVFEFNTAPIGGAVYTFGSSSTAFCGGDTFVATNMSNTDGSNWAVAVRQTPDGNATAFCPTIPAGVAETADGLAVGSCLDCDPALLCSRDATGSLGPSPLQSTGVQCSCNAGFSGSGFVCYPLGSNLAPGNFSVGNLTAAGNASVFNASAFLLSQSATLTAVSMGSDGGSQSNQLFSGSAQHPSRRLSLHFVTLTTSIALTVLGVF